VRNSRTALLPRVLSYVVAITVSASANAQEHCELHIWPSEGLRSIRHNVGANRLGSGYSTRETGTTTSEAITRETFFGEKVVPGAELVLSSAEQAELLRQNIALPSSLGLPNHQAIVHDNPLDSVTIKTSRSRYKPQGAACYADLVIDNITFSYQFGGYGNGHALGILFRFRDFGSSDSIRRSFATQTSLGIRKFPPKSATQMPEARDEMTSAFNSNLVKFASFLEASRTKKKARS
jgi:hypothetical protein